MAICKKLSEGKKWVICLYAAFVFVIISSPFMYKVTNSVTSALGWESSKDGCPNVGGLVLHGVVFAVLMRALMALPVVDEKSS